MAPQAEETNKRNRRALLQWDSRCRTEARRRRALDLIPPSLMEHFLVIIVDFLEQRMEDFPLEEDSVK